MRAKIACDSYGLRIHLPEDTVVTISDWAKDGVAIKCERRSFCLRKGGEAFIHTHGKDTVNQVLRFYAAECKPLPHFAPVWVDLMITDDDELFYVIDIPCYKLRWPIFNSETTQDHIKDVVVERRLAIMRDFQTRDGTVIAKHLDIPDRCRIKMELETWKAINQACSETVLEWESNLMVANHS